MDADIEEAFDPGIGKLLIDFNSFINDAYSKLMTFQSISMKRARFRLINSRIYEAMENNTAFYQGCMLWACFLKAESKTAAAKITGSPFSQMTAEEIKDYDYMMNINFLENYFDSYERDTLYYIGRKIEIPRKWRNIIELYKEFLELNKGFVNTRTSADIVLPKKAAEKTFKEDLKSAVMAAVQNENLKELLRIEI